MKKIILTLIVCPLFVFSQTGPGGVGTNDGTSSLKLWFRPDFGISTTGTSIDSWINGAGVAAHDLTASGTQRPTLNSNSINGNDEVSFDGNDILQITGSLTTSNFITNQASSFLVTKRNAITSSWVYATSPHEINRFSCHITWSNSRVYFDIGTCCSSSARIQVPGLTGLNNYSFWSYDALNSSGKQLYRNGALLQNLANTTLYNSHGSQTFRVGESFKGTLPELIIFNQKVNSAQRIIIENYLSAKYNIVSSLNDLYDKDDVGNGNYDYDVAGIGRVDASNLHDDSQGTGIVRFLNPSELNDDEFLIWGHDNGVQQAIEKIDIPATIQARFGRTWRVSEVNSYSSAIDVGNVDIRFDLTGLGSVTASDLRLLIDTDNDGVFIDETPISGATLISGNFYQFAGVSGIQNNLRFTLGTINTIQTPLPVELLNFTAKTKNKKTVNLYWQTASEINNDYFTIERSENGKDWMKVEIINGTGNSSSLINYSAFDSNPFEGTSYYRLKQTDFDGQYSYSNIEIVNIKNAKKNEVKIYPNPSNGIVTVHGNKNELDFIKIYNILGENVTSQVLFLKINKEKVILDLSKLSTGTYFIKTKTFANKVYKH